MHEARVDPVWASFDDFVTHRGRALWRASWLLTGDSHKAEDLVQTALAKTYGQFDRLNQENGAYEAYVRRTLYTSFVGWWHRRWNGEVPTEATHVPEAPEVQTDLDLKRDVARALTALPTMQRAVIVLRYFEDLSEADTADSLGISVGTVKSHSSRAMAALRRSTHLADQEES